jgi:hypothetical protein
LLLLLLLLLLLWLLLLWLLLWLLLLWLLLLLLLLWQDMPNRICIHENAVPTALRLVPSNSISSPGAFMLSMSKVAWSLKNRGGRPLLLQQVGCCQI